jgi:hypothetical protein
LGAVKGLSAILSSFWMVLYSGLICIWSPLLIKSGRKEEAVPRRFWEWEEISLRDPTEE